MTRLIALGSSFAAGPGIPPQVDTDAGRSANNYPNYLARRLNLDPNNTDEFLDLSVSSATLLNLISEPQDTGKKVYAPQLSLLPELKEGDDGSDTIVTITGGGNDMFYIGSMFGLTFKNTWWGRLLSYFVLSKEEKEHFEHPTIASPDEISQRFARLIDGVQKKYPKATIYLVEYHAMIGPDTKAWRDVCWDEPQVQKYLEMAEQLQSLYAKAAEGAENVYVVPLAEESKQKHALGSKEPWVSDGSFWNFKNRCAYHPNQAGMKAAADIIYDFHTQRSNSKAAS